MSAEKYRRCHSCSQWLPVERFEHIYLPVGEESRTCANCEADELSALENETPPMVTKEGIDRGFGR